ncbi:hypothetical protein LINPERPRIM_LOCUS37930, partial [Linum perenne]
FSSIHKNQTTARISLLANSDFIVKQFRFQTSVISDFIPYMISDFIVHISFNHHSSLTKSTESQELHQSSPKAISNQEMGPSLHHPS